MLLDIQQFEKQCKDNEKLNIEITVKNFEIGLARQSNNNSCGYVFNSAYGSKEGTEYVLNIMTNCGYWCHYSPLTNAIRWQIKKPFAVQRAFFKWHSPKNLCSLCNGKGKLLRKLPNFLLRKWVTCYHCDGSGKYKLELPKFCAKL